MYSNEQSIRRLVATWHAATVAGDVARILPLMAGDVVFLVAGQPPMRGREAFEKNLRSLLATHRITSTFDIQEIRIEAKLAYCWSKLSVVISPLGSGSPTRRRGDALTILQRQDDGAWVVIRDANLLAPETEQS